MHDEACPTYEDMLVNMMHGHHFIQKTFNIRPRIGWQLEAYGHSSTSARLFAELGFDAMFFSRGDIDDKSRMMDDKEMEFIWRPSW
jgi:alpha-mannosidase